ncbi:unnamed protein product, partial [marine sediment metagenome]
MKKYHPADGSSQWKGDKGDDGRQFKEIPVRCICSCNEESHYNADKDGKNRRPQTGYEGVKERPLNENASICLY